MVAMREAVTRAAHHGRQPTRESARLMPDLRPRFRPATRARSEQCALFIIHTHGADPRIHQWRAAGGVAILEACRCVRERWLTLWHWGAGRGGGGHPVVNLEIF
jgi:hypothetical protein